jgi:hypothetical protein
MNVLIIRRNGLIDDSPILVKDDTTAEAVYQSLVRDLTGDDEYTYFNDESLTIANNLLMSIDIQIDWFIDIEINNYTNK